jgi:hypothetical protein
MEAERELFYAFEFTHDIPTMQRMLADDFQEADDHGVVSNKEQMLAVLLFTVIAS